MNELRSALTSLGNSSTLLWVGEEQTIVGTNSYGGFRFEQTPEAAAPALCRAALGFRIIGPE